MIKCENEEEYNYNGSYYMRTTQTAALALSGSSSSGSGSGSGSMPAVESGVTSAMSPGSEVYEPLTPKNDESHSLCGVGPAGGGVSVGGPSAIPVGAADVNDDMDNGPNKKTTTLQVSIFKSFLLSLTTLV